MRGSAITSPLARVRFSRVRAAPDATSNRRKAGVPGAALRVMVAPLPRMVRWLWAAITGSPVAPSVGLFTAVRVKVLPGARLMNLAPPA